MRVAESKRVGHPHRTQRQPTGRTLTVRTEDSVRTPGNRQAHTVPRTAPPAPLVAAGRAAPLPICWLPGWTAGSSDWNRPGIPNSATGHGGPGHLPVGACRRRRTERDHVYPYKGARERRREGATRNAVVGSPLRRAEYRTRSSPIPKTLEAADLVGEARRFRGDSLETARRREMSWQWGAPGRG